MAAVSTESSSIPSGSVAGNRQRQDYDDALDVVLTEGRCDAGLFKDTLTSGVIGIAWNNGLGVAE